MKDVARALVRVRRGGLATVYYCPFCTVKPLVMRKGIGGNRGYGLRVGGGYHSQMSAHIRQNHPRELAEEKARRACEGKPE